MGTAAVLMPTMVSGWAINGCNHLILTNRNNRSIFLVDHAFAHQLLEFALGKDLALDERLGDAFQIVSMFLQGTISAPVGFAEDPSNLLVDQLGRVLGVISELGHLPTEERDVPPMLERTRDRRSRSSRTG